MSTKYEYDLQISEIHKGIIWIHEFTNPVGLASGNYYSITPPVIPQVILGELTP